MIVLFLLAIASAQLIKLDHCTVPPRTVLKVPQTEAEFENYFVFCRFVAEGLPNLNHLDVGVAVGDNVKPWHTTAVGISNIDVYFAYEACIDSGSPIQIYVDANTGDGSVFSATTEFLQDPSCKASLEDETSPKTATEATASAFFVFVVAVTICFCVAYFFVNPRM